MYNDGWYGPITISMEGGNLVISFDHTPGMIGDLQHWQYDTFKAHWRVRTIEDAFVTFQQFPIVMDQVRRAVGIVGHRDRDGLARAVTQSGADSHAFDTRRTPSDIWMDRRTTSAVESVLQSFTTIISYGICSARRVETSPTMVASMQLSSFLAGMTTDSFTAQTATMA